MKFTSFAAFAALFSTGFSSPTLQSKSTALTQYNTRADCRFAEEIAKMKSALETNDLKRAQDAFAILANNRRFCPSTRGPFVQEINRLGKVLKTVKDTAPRKQVGDWNCPSWATVGSSDCYWTGTVTPDHPKPSCEGQWVHVRAGYVCEK